MAFSLAASYRYVGIINSTAAILFHHRLYNLAAFRHFPRTYALFGELATDLLSFQSLKNILILAIWKINRANRFVLNLTFVRLLYFITELFYIPETRSKIFFLLYQVLQDHIPTICELPSFLHGQMLVRKI